MVAPEVFNKFSELLLPTPLVSALVFNKEPNTLLEALLVLLNELLDEFVIVVAVAVVINCCTTVGASRTSENTLPLVSVIVKLPATVASSFCTCVLNAALPPMFTVAALPIRLGPPPDTAVTSPPALRLIAPLPALMVANMTFPDAWTAIAPPPELT